MPGCKALTSRSVVWMQPVLTQKRWLLGDLSHDLQYRPAGRSIDHGRWCWWSLSPVPEGFLHKIYVWSVSFGEAPNMSPAQPGHTPSPAASRLEEQFYWSVNKRCRWNNSDCFVWWICNYNITTVTGTPRIFLYQQTKLWKKKVSQWKEPLQHGADGKL